MRRLLFLIALSYLFRILKILGCQFGCHNPLRGGHLQAFQQTTPSGNNIEVLRVKGVALLSRLLWYDKKQFKHYLSVMIESKQLPFLVGFMHGFLSFCNDPTSPFSSLYFNPPSMQNANNNNSNNAFFNCCSKQPKVSYFH